MKRGKEKPIFHPTEVAGVFWEQICRVSVSHENKPNNLCFVGAPSGHSQCPIPGATGGEQHPTKIPLFTGPQLGTVREE